MLPLPGLSLAHPGGNRSLIPTSSDPAIRPKENERLALEFYPQLVELFFVDGRRRAGEEAQGARGLGEGDDLPDGLLAGEEHDQPVEAQGDAAVGRRPVAQGFEEEAELVPGLRFGARPMALKIFRLKVLVVDPDGAAADLVAVEDDVVGLGPDPGRVGFQEFEVLLVGRGEGMVDGDERFSSSSLHSNSGKSVTQANLNSLGGRGSFEDEIVAESRPGS